MTIEESPITIDLSWHSSDDATHLFWYSDDMQTSIEGGRIDPSRSVESQALEFANQMAVNGHDGTGVIRMWTLE